MQQGPRGLSRQGVKSVCPRLQGVVKPTLGGAQLTCPVPINLVSPAACVFCLLGLISVGPASLLGCVKYPRTAGRNRVGQSLWSGNASCFWLFWLKTSRPGNQTQVRACGWGVGFTILLALYNVSSRCPARPPGYLPHRRACPCCSWPRRSGWPLRRCSPRPAAPGRAPEGLGWEWGRKSEKRR